MKTGERIRPRKVKEVDLIFRTLNLRKIDVGIERFLGGKSLPL